MELLDSVTFAKQDAFQEPSSSVVAAEGESELLLFPHPNKLQMVNTKSIIWNLELCMIPQIPLLQSSIEACNATMCKRIMVLQVPISITSWWTWGERSLHLEIFFTLQHVVLCLFWFFWFQTCHHAGSAAVSWLVMASESNVVVSTISIKPTAAKSLVTTQPKSNSNHFMENFADFGKRWWLFW